MESKLDSVPDLVQKYSEEPQSKVAAEEVENNENNSAKTEDASATTIEANAQQVDEKVKTVAEDETYSKYFKMLKMGVPLQV